ncbi:MAG: PAS domain S-box protein [Helicobacteraceae bacterium]|nr:PAS domain S-box protein [Helicobacteraceae bacterium]
MNFLKNLIIKENFIFILTVFILSMIIYSELNYRKNRYFDEKIYDLTLQYNEKIISNQRISEALFDDVLMNENVIALVNDANNNINKESNRKLLYELLKEKYERMSKKGILQFHFHLADGTSFLRFHKPNKFGDSLLFRDSIQQVMQKKNKIYGFELGVYFGGFRYVYPIFNPNNKYIGSVESSISPKYVINQMQETLDGQYSMILNKHIIDKVVTAENRKEYYHEFCASKNYYMSDGVHANKSLIFNELKQVESEIKKNLKYNLPFAKEIDSVNKHQIVVFIPIEDISGENIGYFISLRDDNRIQKIFISQIMKFFIGILFILVIFYFYKQNREKITTIKQLQNVMNKTTLVSKTDLKGKITYVNDAFVKLSGYSREELLGKPHSLVRHSNMNKETFRNLWWTIKSGNIWYGKVKNKRKDGTSYIVDATIFPIKNNKGQVLEYIAIRHDITELEELKEVLEKELNDSNQSLKDKMNLLSQYEKAIESTASFTRTDTKGNITYLNETHEKVTGFKKEELLGKKHTPMLRDNSVPDSFFKNLWSTIISKNHFKGTIKNITKDGHTIYLDTLIVPIVDLNDNIIEFMSIQYNITDMVNLHKEIEDTQREVIYKMGEIGESRSQETGNHVKRVAQYSKLLALKYGLSKKEAELLYDASPMHDIGKVAIPDNVLKKPGSLDADEWKIMKTHSEIGYNVLKGSNREILKAAATVAHEHHEKYDGSGYPRGLKGEDIHIYGRITAMADVFDALGSNRVYKKAWNDEKIFELFKNEKGTHFDPKLVDIFFENLEPFLEIRDKFK